MTSPKKPPAGPPPRFPQPRRGPAGTMPSPAAAAPIGPGAGYPPARDVAAGEATRSSSPTPGSAPAPARTRLSRGVGEESPIYDELAEEMPAIQVVLP